MEYGNVSFLSRLRIPVILADLIQRIASVCHRPYFSASISSLRTDRSAGLLSPSLMTFATPLMEAHIP